MTGRRTGISQIKPRRPKKNNSGSVLLFQNPKSSSFLKLIAKILEILGRPLFWLLLGIGNLIVFILPELRKFFFKTSKLRPTIFKTASQFIFSISRYAFLVIKLIGRLLLFLINFPLRILTVPKISLPRISFRKTFFLSAIFLLVFGFLVTYFFIVKDLPSPQGLTERHQILSTKIYDRNGTLLYKIYDHQNRTLIKLNDLPLDLIQATVSIEDAEFYKHQGLSYKAILRSLIQDLKGSQLYGGSTITQQLVKNVLLSPERTLQRKIKEMILSIWVEQKFSKDEILQMYLNEVGYGGAAYGVEEAAQTYFGKSAKNLSLAQAALLAGLPASPTAYSPFGAYPERAKERQKKVLQRMVEEGYISKQESQRAGEEELSFAPQKTDIKAPHFVMYIKDLLAEKYGSLTVEEGGLEVKTSLDLKTQGMAQLVVSNEVDKLAGLRVSNGAALVTNPATGEILAMVGSRNYFDLSNDGNVNVTTRLRQPGSSIKPVNYSLALENGFTPATIIPDTPITYQVAGQPPYTPRNYDNRFHGNVPLRTALACSLNVPAVKVLSALGVKNMIEQGQKMGITTWEDISRFGLSLTLGGGEVKMVDMAVVFGTLANLGQRANLNPILEVKDANGKILESTTNQPFDFVYTEGNRSAQGKPSINNPVIDPRIAFIITDILSDNAARTPTFGPHSMLNIVNHPHVAVKTGTTQNLRDNWTIGYTPDYLVTVWVGNNDNTPMSYVASGVTGASPIWNQIMTNLLKEQPDKEWLQPEGLTKTEICSATGTLSCDGCGGKWEYFLNGTEPKNHCQPKTAQQNENEPTDNSNQSPMVTQIVNYFPPD